MAKVERSEIFDIDIEKFYRAISDYKSYPKFVDGVSSIKILEESDKGATVEFTLNLIKKFTYILKLKHQEPKKVSWTLVESDLFTENKGGWTLKQTKDGKLEVTYALDVDFRGFVPNMIINKLVTNNLPGMMQAYFKRAKSLK
ncbi:MAG: SRPBCC family protein [Pseudomonadota bacterium]